ncbi:MAG: ribokinase [Anaerolineales bacterium]|nr:ribokinase [Anaerolineales bacterium]
MPPHIAVVGSLNMDLVIRTPRFPSPGETIIGSAFHTIPGGKGANQAVAAARLGAQVTMVGRVGDDAFGGQQLSNLTQLGIDVSHVRRDAEAATGVALIALDEGGQNSIILAPGANMRFTSADVEAAEQAIASAEVLLLQLEIPLDVVEHVIGMARARGLTTILNPAPARSLPPALLSQVDYLIPNESETTLLTGIEVDSMETARQAAAELRASGVGTVILTLGGRGALILDGQQALHIHGYQVEVVDTTAAGDAFVGGFAVALAEGRDLRGAVRFANGAGALTVTRLGAQPSLPTRSEVEAFLQNQR